MKDFCVIVVKVKNNLGRNRVTARSLPGKWPVFYVWNTANVLRLTASSQMSGYFHPKLDVAYLVQLQTLFLWV